MGKVTIDAAGMEMDTDATDVAMDELGAAGYDIKETWGTQERAINDLERRIGNGPLGRPFAQSYNAEAVPLVEAAHDLFGVPERSAASGKSIVRSYALTEAEITASYEL